MVTEEKQKKPVIKGAQITLSQIRRYVDENKLQLDMSFSNAEEESATYKITDGKLPYGSPIVLVIKFIHYKETARFVITDFYVSVMARIRKEDTKIIDTTALFERIRDICKDLESMGMLIVGRSK